MGLAPIGVLLINVGTPDSPSIPDVRRYLREFLSDPRVLDIPALGRWLLLNAVILPLRPRRSARAYRAVWQAQGSPLGIHSAAFAEALRAQLGEAFRVELGMRYGKPSCQAALDALLAQGAQRLVVFPLFPQYSSAATGSAVQHATELLCARWDVPALTVLGDFFDAPGFIDALAEQVRAHTRDLRPDHVLMSYHGLPERHVARSDGPGVNCARVDACPPVGAGNRFCYRAQAYATSRALASALGLAHGAYSVAFQSRLGRTPWIKPYTDHHLPALHARGVRRLAVCCPSFVADCLETVEEIGIRAKEQWMALGGEAFALVPAVNATPAWVRAAAGMVRAAAQA